MKKNVMMRVASVLLIAVLMSTCVISGTFAKYTTSDEGTDSARVAKWGVDITANGEMFATEESGTDSAQTTIKTVLSSGDDNVVAPGMSGSMAAIEISGTPEVAVKVSHEATVNIEGWILNSDTINSEFYCPLVVTVNETAISGLDYDSADDFETAIVEAINGHSKEYAAGTNLTSADNVDVSWTWAYTATGDQTDEKDTLVADVTATINISITTTVTQID